MDHLDRLFYHIGVDFWIGFAIKNEDRFSQSWSYHIIDERLIAYKHGKITNIQNEVGYGESGKISNGGKYFG